MAEPVKEVPKPAEPAPSEQEITETYIEQRREGKTADLPFAAPTIPEVIPAPPKAEPVPEPATPQAKAIAETDQYLEGRAAQAKEKKQRKARGGEQARIDELVKEAADAKRTAEEATKKLAELEAAKTTGAAAVPSPPIAAPTNGETKVVIPSKQPRIKEFDNVDVYNAAMALWAAAEQAKAAVTPPAAPAPENKSLAIAKDEFDKFLERGKSFMTSHPDFNDTLQAAHVRGLTMTEGARVAITRMAVPEVIYWLAKPENDMAARALMKMDELQQIVEVGKIAQRLTPSATDFVSNAPQPGMRLTGSANADVPMSEIQDTDEYIRRRKQERRIGRGR